MGFSLGSNTTSANPYTVSRSMPATPPSFGLPQNHTLATDPFNQQAQLLSMGMLLPAFDSYGGNKGYYSNQTYQTSPLMQRYLMPQNQTSNWLQHSMGMGMPGWTANGNGTFNASQYNPFMALNYPGNQPQQGQQDPQQMPQLPRQAAPGQQPAQQYFTPEFISNAQSVGLSPEVAYAYQNDPQVKAYLDAMAAKNAAGSAPAPSAPAPTGIKPTDYFSPEKLGSALSNPDDAALNYEISSVLGSNWRDAPGVIPTTNTGGWAVHEGTPLLRPLDEAGYAARTAWERALGDASKVSGLLSQPVTKGSAWGTRPTGASAPTGGSAPPPPQQFTPEFIANAKSVGLSPEVAYAYQTDPAVKAYFDALNAQK